MLSAPNVASTLALESVLTSKSCWSDLDKSQALPKLISTLSKSLL